ncbi:MAG: DUF3800 domain-containing protein [Succinivibrio sp.]|nr:DUF3800 domain-containing protein [Succinivibrio sp.]
MNILVYSDESGVFDVCHNEFFVYAGLVFLSNSDVSTASRKYIHAENIVRKIEGKDKDEEIKATTISNKNKSKLFRSLNGAYKFAGIVNEPSLLKDIFNNKKSKQRYLDYAFKISLKNLLKKLIKKGVIDPDDVESIRCYVDEHTTATNARYELEQSLENEFKIGVFNSRWNKFIPPIFTKIDFVTVKYCDSRNFTLIRSADILANKIYFLMSQGKNKAIQSVPKLVVTYLPRSPK